MAGKRNNAASVKGQRPLPPPSFLRSSTVSAQPPVTPGELEANEPTGVRTTGDRALLMAWKRCLQYSDASDKRKRTHMSVRTTIIVFSFAATVLAVASTYIPPESPYFILFRILLLALPLIVAGTLAFSLQFMPSTSWIAYRIGAELIRLQIYLYRTQSGDYFGKQPHEQQELLLRRLQEADQRVDEIGSPEPYLTQYSDAELLERVANATDRKKRDYPFDYDDGFSPLNIQQYIDWRLVPQRAWYIRRLNENYNRLRAARAGTLLATGFGSFLVAIGMEPAVAVTTALGVALTLLIDLRMYGRTYGIYHLTARRLEDLQTAWEILPAAERNNPARISAFITEIEETFQAERDRWMEQAIQSQVASEQGLLRNVNLANSPFGIAGARLRDALNRDNVQVQAIDALPREVVAASTMAADAAAAVSEPMRQAEDAPVVASPSVLPIDDDLLEGADDEDDDRPMLSDVLNAVEAAREREATSPPAVIPHTPYTPSRPSLRTAARE